MLTGVCKQHCTYVQQAARYRSLSYLKYSKSGKVILFYIRCSYVRVLLEKHKFEQIEEKNYKRCKSYSSFLTAYSLEGNVIWKLFKIPH